MCTTVYHNQQSRADTPSLRHSNSFAFFSPSNPLPVLHDPVHAGIASQGGNCGDLCVWGRFIGRERIISWVRDAHGQADTGRKSWSPKSQRVSGHSATAPVGSPVRGSAEASPGCMVRGARSSRARSAAQAKAGGLHSPSPHSFLHLAATEQP